MGWTHALGALPLRAAGPPQPSPYNPVAADGDGATGERLFVRCREVRDEADGIKTFVFAAPEPPGMGKGRPVAYKPGQYASFDFQVGSCLEPLGTALLFCHSSERNPEALHVVIHATSGHHSCPLVQALLRLPFLRLPHAAKGTKSHQACNSPGCCVSFSQPLPALRLQWPVLVAH